MTGMEALAKFCFKHIQSDDDGFNLLLDKEDKELLEIVRKDLEVFDKIKEWLKEEENGVYKVQRSNGSTLNLF